MKAERCVELSVLDLVPFGQTGSEPLFFALRLACPNWPQWTPGQFVMVRPLAFGLEIPWARPLGICQLNSSHLICFFQVLGRGTRRLAQLKPSDKVLVWGPLGNGFVIEENTATLLLAGGMGLAPFVGYVHRHPQPWNLTMLFAHRPPLDCYPVDSINERITVDTLRETIPGDLDNLIFSLEERIRDIAEQNGLVLACGPLPFLRTVHGFAQKYKARAQLSLENRMACGVGACLGCVTKVRKNKKEQPDQTTEYQQVCTRGPVFWSHDLEF